VNKESKMNKRRNVLIMGAAGRDFYNFNVFFRKNPNYNVVCFTATQIPFVSGRRYPKELSGKLYHKGIPIFDEKDLPKLIKKYNIDVVVLAYSDLLHEDVMHKASLAISCGADFWLMGPKSTQLKSRKPVISVCATRTGAGKTTVTRKIAKIIRDLKKRVVIIRHPMPYGILKKQICQIFTKFEDLEKYKCTIEEKEEFEPYLREGFVVYAGIDYEKIIKMAEKEADVILFEGGNNDFSIIKSDLYVTVADSLRPGHEISSFPGEINTRIADIIIINKTNVASKKAVEKVEENIKKINKKALIIKASSIINIDKPELIRNKRVVVVEDGPTVTHGGLKHAAGYAAAKKYKAKIVKPVGVGSINKAIERYDLNIIPALGYNKKQIKELGRSINATIKKRKCDAVVLGTSSDISKYIKIKKPLVIVDYELNIKEKRKKVYLKKIIKERI